MYEQRLMDHFTGQDDVMPQGSPFSVAHRNPWSQSPFLRLALRLPYTFKGRFFSKKIFTAKLNITSLPSFSKKNYFKILKRARVINKNVFSSETQYTRQRVISQLKCVSVMTSCDVFRGKRFGVFHFMWRPFLLFTLAICDLFTPSFRLCWSLLHLYVQKKKEKSPWLK